MLRRLPVYFLLDCSESMAGEPLDSVTTGLFKTVATLKKDPHALETVYVSFISFATKAKLIAPLTEVSEVEPPTLALRPGTSLGAALDLLRERLQKEVVHTTKETKGDWRPLVFILTDGQPTDDWRKALNDLRSVKPSLAHIYAFGCGDEVDFETLAQIADVSFQVQALTQDSLAKLFVWLTASIQKSVVSPDMALTLEKTLPKDMNLRLIDRDKPPKFQNLRPLLYIHGICLKEKGHFLLKFRFSSQRGFYLFEKSDLLPEDFFEDGAMKSPPVEAEMIPSEIDCPYCHNSGWGKCGFCGHIFCLNLENPPPELTCPFCQSRLRLAESEGSFSIDGSVG
ncbi:MAG: VWA domain-containing protein [Deltaproteobacteria bacterium]|jgi:uncharacterized protein YegL/DNA-directed RNA polymerase subunit RPC12/RpoP|nr:VWA domain-containing protein [Deltaproteobacteria bacterium]